MKKPKTITQGTDSRARAQRDPDALLTTAQLSDRWGGKSPMTFWRYERDPSLDFPKPIRIKRRKHWRIGEIEEFEAAQAAPDR